MSEPSQRRESLCETQALLMRLTVDRFRDASLALQVLEVKPPVAFLVRVFAAASRYRPGQRALLVSVLDAVLSAPQKSAFLRDSFALIVKSPRPAFDAADFLYRCHKTGIFSREQVADGIKHCVTATGIGSAILAPFYRISIQY
jgi:hypothetical protein